MAASCTNMSNIWISLEMSYYITLIAATFCKPICVWNGLGVGSKGNRPNSLIKPLSADCHQLRNLSGVFPSAQMTWRICDFSCVWNHTLCTIIIGFLTCVCGFQNGDFSETNYVIQESLSRKTRRQPANMELLQTCIYSGIQGWKDIKSDILKCIKEIFRPMLHNDCIISVFLMCVLTA